VIRFQKQFSPDKSTEEKRIQIKSTKNLIAYQNDRASAMEVFETGKNIPPEEHASMTPRLPQIIVSHYSPDQR
jgi:hypothetical protein